MERLPDECTRQAFKMAEAAILAERNGVMKK
jgi:hypothetical protein